MSDASQNPTDADLHRFGYAPGGYMITCADCGGNAMPHGAAKRAWRCRPCAVKLWQAAPAPAPPAVSEEARRAAACLKAFEGWPTDIIERGLFAELHSLVAVCALADHMGEVRDGSLVIPAAWWQKSFRTPMDRLNALAAERLKRDAALSVPSQEGGT